MNDVEEYNENGKCYYKSGLHGTKYYFTEGNENSKKKAYMFAIRQCHAKMNAKEKWKKPLFVL